jgi:hypothetical protein
MIRCAWHATRLFSFRATARLDDQFPSRDLYLARSHSVFVDGYLIPVELLVNNEQHLDRTRQNGRPRRRRIVARRVGNPRGYLCGKALLLKLAGNQRAREFCGLLNMKDYTGTLRGPR